jgi:hypothetical protein
MIAEISVSSELGHSVAGTVQSSNTNSGVPVVFKANHPAFGSVAQFVRREKVALAPELEVKHEFNGVPIAGALAEAVRSIGTLLHTTTKFVKFGTVLSYVNEPDVGSIPVPVNVMV